MPLAARAARESDAADRAAARREADGGAQPARNALSRLCERLGISRITDSTALDHLGLPVFAAIRPRGLTLRVHAGKARDRAAARLGACMEAVEYAAVEAASACGPDGTMPAGRLQAAWGGRLDWADLAPRHGATLRLDRPLAWCACIVLGAPGASPTQCLPLPAERVLLPFDDPHQPGVFGSNSHGQAAAFSLDDAVLRGLLEVLERDAVAMNLGRDASARVTSASLPPPWGRLQARWRAAGVALHLRHLPNDFGLPAFEALLHEPTNGGVNLAGGSGLNPDPATALGRAIAEAAQSRLSTIHGGRDDLTHYYSKFSPDRQVDTAAREARLLARAADAARSVHFGDVPAAPSALRIGAPGDRLEAHRRHLAALGFPLVLVRRFDTPGRLLAAHGVHVVRVVVPRCEVPPEGRGASSKKP